MCCENVENNKKQLRFALDRGYIPRFHIGGLLGDISQPELDIEYYNQVL